MKSGFRRTKRLAILFIYLPSSRILLSPIINLIKYIYDFFHCVSKRGIFHANEIKFKKNYGNDLLDFMQFKTKCKFKWVSYKHQGRFS